MKFAYTTGILCYLRTHCDHVSPFLHRLTSVLACKVSLFSIRLEAEQALASLLCSWNASLLIMARSPN